MAAKKTELVNYWSVYKAINFKRFNKGRNFIDADSGKEYSYEFVGEEMMKKSVFIQVFSGILWLSPVFLTIFVSLLYLPVCSYSFFIAIAVIIAYHFAAMYYIIRGPHLIISPSKKKGLFSRK